MKKRIGLVTTLLGVSLLAFTGCVGGNNAAYDKQIADLQTQITQLQQDAETKTQQNDDLQRQIDALQQELEQEKIAQYLL